MKISMTTMILGFFALPVYVIYGNEDTIAYTKLKR